jgi:hypothetical protein
MFKSSVVIKNLGIKFYMRRKNKLLLKHNDIHMKINNLHISFYPFSNQKMGIFTFIAPWNWHTIPSI